MSLPVLSRALMAALLASALLAAHARAAGSPEAGPADFAGKIGTTRLDSLPAWPAGNLPAKGAPNVLLVLLDDAGFALTSTFGGLARTPNLDRLAAEGVRYNRFHTTAICSPTRASLLTGRNQHQVGFGNLQDIPAGFPGYNTIWNPATASIAEVLKEHGYSTAAFGKWHNTPQWEITPAGPFDHWPTGLGFEHFYGFLAGDASQWEPRLYRDTTPVEAPARPDQGYHLTTDLVNEAVHWVHDHEVVAPARPWFVYFATGAVHMPHHVPKEWIERNKGRYDAGWDQLRSEVFERQKRLGVIPADTRLTPRPPGLPAWSSLSAAQKQLYAHQMEVFSAYMEHTDREVGRLIDEVRRSPGGENTLVLYIVGDNGGSAEGGLDGASTNEAAVVYGAHETVASQLAHADDLGGPGYANHYPAAWAWFTTTPFQWMKQVASHFGGTRNPLIVSWPGHTSDPAQIRSQFAHVNDIAPTIYAAAGIQPPAIVKGVPQLALEGNSLVPSFTDAKAPEQHHTQYFEIFGNRAIYHDGWVAAAKRNYDPWNLLHEVNRVFAADFDHDRWELYAVDRDFSEADDLATSQPAKLTALRALFEAEARRNGVFPLVPLPLGAPSVVEGRRSFTFPGDISPLPQVAVPDLTARSHRLEADLQLPTAQASGVIVAEGGRYGGFSLYLNQGRLVYENNIFGQQHTSIVSETLLPAGAAKVAYEFTSDPAPDGGAPNLLRPQVRGGVGRLYVDGKLVGEGRLTAFGGFGSSFGETFDIGTDRGSPVSSVYTPPFSLNGKVLEVRLTLR